jgi:exonuclease SbcD
MRFLHTADWHLGRSLHGESLLDAQAAIIEHTACVARDQQVDCVVLAGDVFDRAMPPGDAVALWDDAQAQIRAVCPLIVISGNHDSATRLGMNRRLLDGLGLHIRTEAATIGQPIVIDDTCIYAIPYLEPDVVRAELGCEERGHEAVLTSAMRQIRADLAGRPAGCRSVVVAHAFVTGAEVSSSERDLSVGGSASVAAGIFKGTDYLALGHLHGPQRVASIGRYAGSPLAFSFSEQHQTKSIAVVDLGPPEPVVELIATPVPRPLATITGEIETLLTDPALAVHEQSWVQAIVTDAGRPIDAMARVQKRFPHARVLEHRPQGAVPLPENDFGARLETLGDVELMLDFVERLRGTEASDDERALLENALAAGRAAEVAV